MGLNNNDWVEQHWAHIFREANFCLCVHASSFSSLFSWVDIPFGAYICCNKVSCWSFYSMRVAVIVYIVYSFYCG